jgi:hypothetical protein
MQSEIDTKTHAATTPLEVPGTVENIQWRPVTFHTVNKNQTPTVLVFGGK